MKKSMLILICVLLCMFAFTAGVTAQSILPDVLPDSNYSNGITSVSSLSVVSSAEVDGNLENTGYDIVTGDGTPSAYRVVNTTNINISGVDVQRHAALGNRNYLAILPANTSKEAEMTFALDCITKRASLGADHTYVFVNGTLAEGSMALNPDDGAKGVWTYSMVPQWNEKNEATIEFRVTYDKNASTTYTLTLRILGEENNAPTLKSGVEKESSALTFVGESYSIDFEKTVLFEDPELDDLSYLVSINGGEDQIIGSLFYVFNPKEPGEYTLVFKAKDSSGNISSDTYTVKVTCATIAYVEIGGTAVEAWNVDINKIGISLCDVKKIEKSEDEANTWYVILDENTSTEDALYFRVKASASAGRFQGVNINGRGVDGCQE